MRFDFALKRPPVRIAAEMRTEEDVEAIHAADSALDRTADGAGSGVEADLELHLAIAHASHNPFFVSTVAHALAPIRQCMERARNLGQTQCYSGQVQAEHQAIIDGVVKRSPNKPALR